MAIFDLVDENDQKIGKTATYEEVLRDNLWHRGVHIILATPELEIIMQKRAANLGIYPNEVEVSVGGGVNCGETPEMAIHRETQEEMGINLRDHSLTFLGRRKFNHSNQKCFIYCYTSEITDKQELKPQATEVIDAFLLPLNTLKEDLKKGEVEGVGRVVPIFDFWKFMVDGIEKPRRKQSIHFVCRGNRFRSRIAETIVNSKNLRNFCATSSGIEAVKEKVLSPWAELELKNNSLPVSYRLPCKPDPTQLTKADAVVVLSKDILNDANYLHDFNPVVWDVADIDGRASGDLTDLNNPKLQRVAEQVFAEIDFNTSQLLDQLAKSEVK